MPCTPGRHALTDELVEALLQVLAIRREGISPARLEEVVELDALVRRVAQAPGTRA